MDSKLVRHSSDKMQTSQRLEMQSPGYAEWIIREVTILAGALKETITSPTYTVYAQALWDIPEHCLKAMFLRVPRECEFLPKPKEMREMALANHERKGEAEWQGPTEEEKAERQKAIDSGELKEFWAEMKRVAQKKAFPVKREIRAVVPIRELTDAEIEARKDLLRQQAEVARKKYEAS